MLREHTFCQSMVLALCKELLLQSTKNWNKSFTLSLLKHFSFHTLAPHHPSAILTNHFELPHECILPFSSIERWEEEFWHILTKLYDGHSKRLHVFELNVTRLVVSNCSTVPDLLPKNCIAVLTNQKLLCDIKHFFQCSTIHQWLGRSDIPSAIKQNVRSHLAWKQGISCRPWLAPVCYKE